MSLFDWVLGSSAAVEAAAIIDDVVGTSRNMSDHDDVEDDMRAEVFPRGEIGDENSHLRVLQQSSQQRFVHIALMASVRIVRRQHIEPSLQLLELGIVVGSAFV